MLPNLGCVRPQMQCEDDNNRLDFRNYEFMLSYFQQLSMQIMTFAVHKSELIIIQLIRVSGSVGHRSGRVPLITIVSVSHIFDCSKFEYPRIYLRSFSNNYVHAKFLAQEIADYEWICRLWYDTRSHGGGREGNMSPIRVFERFHFYLNLRMSC